MSSVVNLRLARKRKTRAEKEQAASENRALHGRSKAEKSRDLLNSEKSASFIAGHRLEPQDRGRKP
jgi:hypothetical protein